MFKLMLMYSSFAEILHVAHVCHEYMVLQPIFQKVQYLEGKNEFIILHPIFKVKSLDSKLIMFNFVG